jgi:hypothetical protein
VIVRTCAAIWAVATLLAIGPASRPARAYADGAPPGFTGGFKEQACDACHFESPLNAKPGQLTIAGVPDRFTPGQRYTLTLTLSHPTMKNAGVQMSARLENGGAQAGTLAAAPGDDTRVRIETQGGVQYANQRLDGTTLIEPRTARWTIVWTAPAAAGTVMFHAAANAADKDEATRGDFVYTAMAASRAE